MVVIATLVPWSYELPCCLLVM